MFCQLLGGSLARTLPGTSTAKESYFLDIRKHDKHYPHSPIKSCRPTPVSVTLAVPTKTCDLCPTCQAWLDSIPMPAMADARCCSAAYPDPGNTILIGLAEVTSFSRPIKTRLSYRLIVLIFLGSGNLEGPYTVCIQVLRMHCHALCF